MKPDPSQTKTAVWQPVARMVISCLGQMLIKKGLDKTAIVLLFLYRNAIVKINSTITGKTLHYIGFFSFIPLYLP